MEHDRKCFMTRAQVMRPYRLRARNAEGGVPYTWLMRHKFNSELKRNAKGGVGVYWTPLQSRNTDRTER